MNEQTQAAEKPEKIEQNGIVRPKADTDSGRVFAAFEAASDKLGRPVTRAELAEDSAMKSINTATFATQYARCVKFHNVGEVLKSQRTQAATDAKAAKQAAADEAKKAAAEKKAADEAAKKEAAEKKEAEAAAKAKAKEDEKARKAAEKEATKQAKAAGQAAA